MTEFVFLWVVFGLSPCNEGLFTVLSGVTLFRLLQAKYLPLNRKTELSIYDERKKFLVSFWVWEWCFSRYWGGRGKSLRVKIIITGGFDLHDAADVTGSPFFSQPHWNAAKKFTFLSGNDYCSLWKRLLCRKNQYVRLRDWECTFIRSFHLLESFYKIIIC